VDCPHQSYGLVRQIRALQARAAAARIPLVEDQVEHMQHGVQALGTLHVRGHPERHARRFDPLLGPANSLRHRRFGHEKGRRDLGGRQTSNRPQRQRDRRRTREEA
jgi:hypothetical protein